MSEPDVSFASASARGAEASAREDWASAASWWERAWRLSFQHAIPGLQFATALTRIGDPRAIAALQAHPGYERRFAIVLPLAAALLRHGRADEAASTLENFLSRTNVDWLPPLAPLAAALARAKGAAGWLGWSHGRLVLGPAQDGQIDPREIIFRTGRKVIALAWRQDHGDTWSAALDLNAGPVGNIVSAAPLLGNPLRASEIQQLDGVVERVGRQLRIRAWHHGNPSQPPVVALVAPGWRHVATLSEPVPVSASHPLTQCWRVHVDVPDVPSIRVISAVTGEPLLGSPIAMMPQRGPTYSPSHRNRGAALIVSATPRQMPALLDRLPELARLGAERLILVQDGPVRPRPVRAMPPNVELLEVSAQPGLAACWNAGAQRAEGCDVLVMSHDARLWPGALAALKQASGPSGVGIPFGREDLALESASAAVLAEATLAAEVAPFEMASASLTSVGALFLRRRCLEALGGFNEGAFVFAEPTLTEYAARAAAAGRQVRVAPASFVWRIPSARSYGPIAEFARARDDRALASLQAPLPGGVGASILAWRAICASWLVRSLRQCGSATLLITHDEGGGVERHVQERSAVLQETSSVAILRSRRGHRDLARLELAADPQIGLDFQLPSAMNELVDLLRRADIVAAEIHHLRQHIPTLTNLLSVLDVPYTVTLHDYALVCPRVTLISENRAFCHEKRGAACEECAAAFLRERGERCETVRSLRRRSRSLLANATRVIAPSPDTAARFKRYFASLPIDVRPWEISKEQRSAIRTSDPVTVCAVGAFNHAKGFDILLDCVKEAAACDRPLRFVIVGHTIDDEALIEAGAFVTGPYDEAERAALIIKLRPAVGLFPSIWPETWSYALTGLLDAGVPTACFDLGAQADRVRAASGLAMPLGCSAASINQCLLELAQ